MRESQTAGFGARCAIHPDRTASRTCARCGNFTCDECNVGGAETMCPTCRSLTGAEAFPFTRDSYSFDGVWNYSFEKWKQEWVMLSVCVLILVAVSFVAVFLNSIFQAAARLIIGDRGGMAGVVGVGIVSSVMSQIVSMVVQGTFIMGLIRILIDVLNGKKADVGRILTQLPKLGRYILQVILVQLMVVLPVLLYMGTLLVIAAVVSGLSIGDFQHWERAMRGPGMAIVILGGLALIPALYYFTLPLMFANMELVYGDTSPIESIRRAYLIANGHRLSILGFGFISGLVFLVGFVACCVGIIPAVGLGYMLLIGLYLALRNGSGLPPPVET